MIGPDGDEAVLAFLRGYGPGTVTAKQVSAATGIPRVAARTAIMALSVQGLVCTVQWAGDWGTGQYEVRHLHAAPGTCEHSLGCEIVEDPA